MTHERGLGYPLCHSHPEIPAKIKAGTQSWVWVEFLLGLLAAEEFFPQIPLRQGFCEELLGLVLLHLPFPILLILAQHWPWGCQPLPWE